MNHNLSYANKAQMPPSLIGKFISQDWLIENNACEDGIAAFKAKFPNGATYLDTRLWIKEIGKTTWADWLKARLGGDIIIEHELAEVTGGDYDITITGMGGVASAGHKGTATAGNNGTAVTKYFGNSLVGDYGTAIAGDCGNATAGNYGIAKVGYKGRATVGDYGTAKAGYNGIAMAGLNGIAAAGPCGTIIITYKEKQQRKLKMGHIGQGGLLSGVFYALNSRFEFEKVEKHLTNL